MDTDEERIIRKLDSLLAGEKVRRRVDALADEVERMLRRTPDETIAWTPIPLEIYGSGLPGMIRSSWVFIIRPDSCSGAERHPNSHQRMMSYRGDGNIQVWKEDRWLSNVLSSSQDVPLDRRWISIPPNVWHQAVTGEEAWVVVSFHTVPEDELIEERPSRDIPDSTIRRKYQHPE